MKQSITVWGNLKNIGIMNSLSLISVTIQKYEKCAPIKILQSVERLLNQGTSQILWASGPAAENADQ